jgi:hypothetical protein
MIASALRPLIKNQPIPLAKALAGCEGRKPRGAGQCAGNTRQPGGEPVQVHGGGRGDVLQMGLGEPSIAGLA